MEIKDSSGEIGEEQKRYLGVEVWLRTILWNVLIYPR